MKMKPNVLQHQYAVVKAGNEDLILSTKGIAICTGWYGWDSKNKIAFLCHFDHPCTAFSVPDILKAIKEKSPSDHHFKSVLIGGKRWFWSPCTRNIIKMMVSSQNLIKICIKDGPYDNWPHKKRNIIISATYGVLSTEKLHGKYHPKGIKWFFKPMEKVEI